MRTSRFNGLFAPVWIAFPLYIITSKMRTPRYFIKQTRVPGLYRSHWIMGTPTWLSHKFVRHCWSIQQLNISYNSIGLHSSSLWSAFLASIQQGRALERAIVALNSMGMHCHAYQKYTGSLWNIGNVWYHNYTQTIWPLCFVVPIFLILHSQPYLHQEL